MENENRSGRSVVAVKKVPKSRVVDGLIERYQLETRRFITIQSDVSAFCVWFHRYSERLERSSFVSYRKWVAKKLVDDGYESEAEVVRGVEWKREPPKDLPKRKRSKKDGHREWINNQKGVDTADLSGHDITLLLDLATSENKQGDDRYRMGAFVDLMFRSGCMTGLRPIEWITAKAVSGVDDNGVRYDRVLEVLTSGKGTGELEGRIRFLLCDHFTDDEWRTVESTLEAFRVIKEGYESIGGDETENIKEYYDKLIYRPVGATLRKLCGQLFGGEQKVTPYTPRHLYAAEFRRGQFGGRCDLAAALGHTDIVNQTYYGDAYEYLEKRHFAWSLAKPHSGHIGVVVDNVRRRSENSMRRLEVSKAKRSGASRNTPVNGDGM